MPEFEILNQTQICWSSQSLTCTEIQLCFKVLRSAILCLFQEKTQLTLLQVLHGSTRWRSPVVALYCHGLQPGGTLHHHHSLTRTRNYWANDPGWQLQHPAWPEPGHTQQQRPWNVPWCHWTGFLSTADPHAGYQPSNSHTPIQTAVTFGYCLLPTPCSTLAGHRRWAIHTDTTERVTQATKLWRWSTDNHRRKWAQRTWMALDEEMLLMCAWNPLILFSKGLSGQQQPARKSSIKTSINLLPVSFSYLLSGFISFK